MGAGGGGGGGGGGRLVAFDSGVVRHRVEAAPPRTRLLFMITETFIF